MGLCIQCAYEWKGQTGGHCARCHRQFRSDGAFDRHLVIEHGPGIHRVIGCADPLDVVDRRGRRLLWPKTDPNGRITWGGPPMTDEARTRIAGSSQTTRRGTQDDAGHT